MSRFLDTDAARSFYDRFGARQDTQAFYEDAALDLLVAGADLSQARRVFEFGCGTGRLAERVLSRELPPEARYWGCDISGTMIRLACGRLGSFGARATLWQNEGRPDFAAAGPFDRILATYVLDLLPPDTIAAFLAEAAAALTPGGLLAVAGLTPGETTLSAATSRLWSLVHRARPTLVGGCRPLRLVPFLESGPWRLRHRQVVSGWSVPSEVIIAERIR